MALTRRWVMPGWMHARAQRHVPKPVAKANFLRGPTFTTNHHAHAHAHAHAVKAAAVVVGNWSDQEVGSIYIYICMHIYTT